MADYFYKLISGCDVAQYCAKNLPNVILKSEMYRHGELGGALVDSFHKLDATLVEEDVISELKLLAGVDENDVDDDGIVMFYYNAYIQKQRMKFIHS